MRDKAVGLGLCALGAALLTSACAKQQQAQPGAEGDEARIARLERDARVLAKADGCSSADQCRFAPVGERPCGGPRDYVVYCARSTDSAGLYRKLAELRQAELEFNKKSGAMGTCEFRTPPELAASGGSCGSR